MVAGACGGKSHEVRVTEVVPESDAGVSAVGGSAPVGGVGGAAREAGGVTGSGGAAGVANSSGGMSVGAGGDSSQCDPSSLASGSLELITVAPGCVAADGDSEAPRLTWDGRYVTFQSDADDLVPNDLNGHFDAYLFDREQRTIDRLNVTPTGDSSIGYGFRPVASDDGRWVAFSAYTYDLAEPEPREGVLIYLRDRSTQTTRLLPGSYVCAETPQISSDGSLIVWETYTSCTGEITAEHYYGVLEYDQNSDVLSSVGETHGSDNYGPAISRDGRWLVRGIRPPDSRGAYASELVIRDRSTGEDQIAAVGLAFNYASITVSDDGNVVAYANNGQIYRYDHAASEPRLVSANAQGDPANDVAWDVALSGDGRRLVFTSVASDLVENDTNGVRDLFLYDADTRELSRLSLAPDGAEADDESADPAISGDGRFVAFASKARNLLPASTSGNWQIFVLDLGE